METIVTKEQCNSRIIHLPHFWRVDGKSVTPLDVSYGNRHLRSCEGKAMPPAKVTERLTQILKERTLGKWVGCYIYISPTDLTRLREISESYPGNKPWVIPQPLNPFGFDVIYDTDLAPNTFEIRTMPGEHQQTLTSGKVFDEQPDSDPGTVQCDSETSGAPGSGQEGTDVLPRAE